MSVACRVLDVDMVFEADLAQEARSSEASAGRPRRERKRAAVLPAKFGPVGALAAQSGASVQ